jgi:hypothetical protein
VVEPPPNKYDALNSSPNTTKKKKNSVKYLPCKNIKKILNHVWWCTPVIPAFGRLRQEDHEFKASLGHIARLCLKKKDKK